MRLLLLLLASTLQAEVLEIDKGIYQVTYDTNLEQPLKVSYALGRANTVKAADRKGMNFKKEPGVHTSDDKDYYKNVWDKGHLAPAATFSDSRENLKQTFSYLNSALQNQYLNRGAWRLLEEQERRWDDSQELIVTVFIEFSDSILPTGANIPSYFTKQIYFTDDNVYKCYYFPNERPEKDWEEYIIECDND